MAFKKGSGQIIGQVDTVSLTDSILINQGSATRVATLEQIANSLDFIASADLTQYLTTVDIERDTTPKLGGYLDYSTKGITYELSITAGESFEKRQVVRLDLTTGKVTKANAASENLSDGLLFMTLSAIAAGTSVASFLREGTIVTSGLDPGSIYYLEASAGGITSVAPTEQDHVVRKVGQALTTTRLIFSPFTEFVVNTASAIVPNVPSQITDLAVVAEGDGFVTLDWTSPNANNSSLTKYTIEYQDPLTASTCAWVCVTAPTDDSQYSVSGLNNGTQYLFRNYATNSVGNGTPSNVVSATPSISSDTTLTSIIPTGLVAWWDAKTYVSTSSTWGNSILSPADGSSAEKYLVTPTHVSTFNVNSFRMNNSAYFTNTSNTDFIHSLHKTDGTSNWTWIFVGKTGSGAASFDTLFSTASVSGDYGFNVRSDSAGALKADFYNGTTRITTSAPYVLQSSKRYNIAISRDSTAKTLGFCISEYGVTASSWNNIGVTALTSNVSANATRNWTLGAEAGGDNAMDVSTVMFTQILVNRKISDAELKKVFSWADSYYSEALSAPTAPALVVANPGVGEVFLATYTYADGNSPVTNYRWEYRADTTAEWTSVNNTGATIPYTVSGLTTGTKYLFRSRAVNNVGISDYSSVVSATPISSFTATPYVETSYKCTFPVNGSANGPMNGTDAWEITQPDLLSANNVWFTRGSATITFTCPDGGATTDNATYARTELRHLEDIPYTTLTQDEVDFAVTRIPDGHKTVVHQIHGLGTPPWFKLSYTGKDNGTGTLRTLCKVSTQASIDTTTTLLTGITNGQRIVSRVEYTGPALQFYVNGVLIHSQPVSYTTGSYYWKRGNYYQHANRLGNVCKVVHYLNNNNYIGTP